MCDAETAYALALAFDLLPTPEQRQRAGDRLAALVQEGGYTIRTGFVGTPLICDALCSTGHHRTAYRLLTQRECPSWLYPVTMGATTIWERWDSMLPDGAINPGEMTSFNHYALGAVADWMQRTIGGLAPAEPGYRRLEIRPRPGGALTHAAGAPSHPLWAGRMCVAHRGDGASPWRSSSRRTPRRRSSCPAAWRPSRLVPASGAGRFPTRTRMRAGRTAWTT
jgi:alpha-L-rhamnosidase